MKRYYYVTFNIQAFNKPDDLLDYAYETLCQARSKNPRNKPIYKKISFSESADMSVRFIPNDEICQCCTEFALMVRGIKND